jgi:hypothetical protein
VNSAVFGSFFLFRTAKPPLSPPFHPHSCVSDCRSVPVGCSRFSRRCYLVSVLGFLLTAELRSTATKSFELGCSVQTFCQVVLCCWAHGLLTIAQRFISLSTHPQPMQQYRQLAAPGRGVRRERQPHSTESATADSLVC